MDFIRRVILLIDNYDSFTYILNDYILSLGAETRVLRNDQIDPEQIRDYQALVVSPGPGRPDQAGFTLEAIRRMIGHKPIFGVCLGMQAIGELFGFELKQASYPMHGKTSVLTYEERHPMFHGIVPPLEVCRYHSLLLEARSEKELQVVATSESGEMMAIAHREFPVWAVQFHPESVLSSQGKQIIKNWLKNFNLQ
jgi:anthranilate synthase/aminodeoxychorismate synthase-like glutamine amidotransferase